MTMYGAASMPRRQTIHVRRRTTADTHSNLLDTSSTTRGDDAWVAREVESLAPWDREDAAKVLKEECRNSRRRKPYQERPHRWWAITVAAVTVFVAVIMLAKGVITAPGVSSLYGAASSRAASYSSRKQALSGATSSGCTPPVNMTTPTEPEAQLSDNVHMAAATLLPPNMIDEVATLSQSPPHTLGSPTEGQDSSSSGVVSVSQPPSHTLGAQTEGQESSSSGALIVSQPHRDTETAARDMAKHTRRLVPAVPVLVTLDASRSIRRIFPTIPASAVLDTTGYIRRIFPTISRTSSVKAEGRGLPHIHQPPASAGPATQHADQQAYDTSSTVRGIRQATSSMPVEVRSSDTKDEVASRSGQAVQLNRQRWMTQWEANRTTLVAILVGIDRVHISHPLLSGCGMEQADTYGSWNLAEFGRLNGLIMHNQSIDPIDQDSIHHDSKTAARALDMVTAYFDALEAFLKERIQLDKTCKQETMDQQISNRDPSPSEFTRYKRALGNIHVRHRCFSDALVGVQKLSSGLTQQPSALALIASIARVIEDHGSTSSLEQTVEQLAQHLRECVSPIDAH